MSLQKLYAEADRIIGAKAIAQFMKEHRGWETDNAKVLNNMYRRVAKALPRGIITTNNHGQAVVANPKRLAKALDALKDGTLSKDRERVRVLPGRNEHTKSESVARKQSSVHAKRQRRQQSR